MSQAFRFGFGDEDVEVDDTGEDDTPQDGGESMAEEEPGLMRTPHTLDIDNIVRPSLT